MCEFSEHQSVDDTILPCREGNWFLSDFSNPQVVSFAVNGKTTGTLPNNIPYKLPNALETTTNRLTFSGQGREITLAEDLSVFNRTEPEQTGVIVGDFPRVASARSRPAGRTADHLLLDRTFTAGASDEEEVINIAVPNDQASIIPGDGTVDINSCGTAIADSIAEVIAGTIASIDSIGLAQIKDVSNSYVDMTFSGTNTPPMIVQAIDEMRKGGGFAFLRRIIRQGVSTIKIWTNSVGSKMVSFRAVPGLKAAIARTPWVVSGLKKVAIIGTAVKDTQMWSRTSQAVARKLPVVSYIFVGAVDWAEWAAQPATERDLSDLMATLFIDMSKLVLSTIGGAVMTAIAIGFGVVGAATFAAVILGVGAAVVAGVALDALDEYFDISIRVKALFDRIGDNLNPTMTRFEAEHRSRVVGVPTVDQAWTGLAQAW
ncbi:MAG: hypothetical protein ACK5JT_04525 [Hyphomicrobiaceae bacterium]